MPTVVLVAKERMRRREKMPPSRVQEALPDTAAVVAAAVDRQKVRQAVHRGQVMVASLVLEA